MHALDLSHEVEVIDMRNVRVQHLSPLYLNSIISRLEWFLKLEDVKMHLKSMITLKLEFGNNPI